MISDQLVRKYWSITQINTNRLAGKYWSIDRGANTRCLHAVLPSMSRLNMHLFLCSSYFYFVTLTRLRQSSKAAFFCCLLLPPAIPVAYIESLYGEGGAVVFVLKSGLRISIRAPEVLFSGPPKHPKWPVFGVLGSQKWHFGCPNQNSKTTFQYKYPP